MLKNEKLKALLKGIVRTFLSVVLVGILMSYTGQLNNRWWILLLSMAVLPWYYVYTIYIKPELSSKS